MLKLTPTWCGPLTTPGVLNLKPEFLQCIMAELVSFELVRIDVSLKKKKNFYRCLSPVLKKTFFFYIYKLIQEREKERERED